MSETDTRSQWFSLNTADALHRLKTDPDKGLRSSEAERRLEQYGPNELQERGAKSAWWILWEQVSASMMVILLAAAAISALLGDFKDAVAILVIIVINVLFGFRQEYKAEQAMAALRRLTVPDVKVLRDGSIREVSARNLVPGDIVHFEEGALIPADCRLVDQIRLQVQEAALTGESAPVEKDSKPALDTDTPLAERRNMAYMGTAVTYGRGRGVVVHTGMETELGRIAAMIQTVEDETTPLQKRLKRLGKTLAAAALLLIGVVIALGALRGEDFKLLFLTAVSLAVAAIPEGLPAVVTIALALGSQRMFKRRALIRKLPAVETLGSVTVICTDKTGTLTENRMSVALLETAQRRIRLEDYREQVLGDEASAAAAEGASAFQILLAGSALCNNAAIRENDTEGFQAVGDPTETALLNAAADAGLAKPELENYLPRIAEIPFDSQRKRMTTVHRLEAAGSDLPPAIELLRSLIAPDDTDLSFIAFTKGAVDSLLEISKGMILDGRAQPLTAEWKERISEADNRLARQGMRVLGLACKGLVLPPEDGRLKSTEQDLVFAGMMGIIDPPRPEAKGAVAKCKTAGIRPVMITGDHPFTALNIAEELGIAPKKGRVTTGSELARMPARELKETVQTHSVYARVAPAHKLNIVQALQDQGHIVSMTGDGVNDAPALKRADIGVAMGVTGTDVSKQVSDMVLLDDNFSTIVAAVEEGRIIYDNIRKFIKYLLTTNFGEILVMLLAPFLGMPLPLLPLQILWINLVTDGLPALALSIEPAEKDIMNRPPRHPNETVFARGVGRHILWVGVVMGLVPLGAGFFFWKSGRPEWQTVVFVTLTFAQLAHVMAIRSERDSLLTIGIFSNRPLFGAVLLTAVLQFAVIYIPPVSKVFRTLPLALPQLVLCIALSWLIFWVVEFEKYLARRKRRRA